MMTSKIFSRLIPSANDEPSSHRDRRRGLLREPSNLSSDLEDQLGTDLDEENLGARFQDQDLDNLLADAAESHMTTESVAIPRRLGHDNLKSHGVAKSGWGHGNAIPGTYTDDDDDVPESLLLEGHGESQPTSRNGGRGNANDGEGLPPPVPGPASRTARAQWEKTRTQQRLHGEDRTNVPYTRRPGPYSYDPKERAMWMWANVQDLDGFLHEVYDYFRWHGMWSILLARVLNILQVAFVVGFSTFLMFCIDWSKLPHQNNLRGVVHEKCFRTKVHGLWVFLLWLFCVVWLYYLVTTILEIPRLRQMHDFYHHLLDIPDRDIQTVSWQYVVSRLMALRDANLMTAQNLSARNRKELGDQSRERMDAHDIANRLMRRQNYLIALFNKEILDLTVPVPFLGNIQFFSKTTEALVSFCVLDFVFDKGNQVNRRFLTDRNRAVLVENLKNRFIRTGYLSIVGAPFAVVFFLVSYFLRYFTEYRKDPGQLSSRTFTPLAEWKFREFNELIHLFELRRNMAYPYADRYLQQFPKHKMEQLYNFIGFVSGSFFAVLALAAALDPELFLGFQVTDGKTVLFYMGVFSGIWTFARNNVSTQDEPVMDPKLALSCVIEFTHYCPVQWKGRLHTDEVRQEFTSLYQLKIVMFLEEVLSMVLTPYILITRLPKCSERIVDFFREFTIHVDGVGSVCSYAVFDFKKGAENAARPKPELGHEDSGLRDDYYATKDAKLAASLMGFMENYVTNPTRNRRYTRNPKNTPFYPPPTFSLYNLGGEPAARSGSRPPPLTRAATHTPRVNPAPGRSSPMHSILLDPHHQPSQSSMRNSSRQNTQARFRGSRVGTNESNELNEEPETQEPMQRMATSRIIEEDSSLGESWRTTKVVQSKEEDDDDDGDQAPGVLGLLYQFQKRQTEGRGGLGM